MSATSAEKVAGGRLGTVITVVAIAISLFVMNVLISANMDHRQKLRERQILATLVPAAGKLFGQNALDGSEWAPPEGNGHMMVLFGVTETGQAGDVEFWREVASRSIEAAPDTQFVGLCLAGAKCSLPPGAGAQVTLLKFMDPVQTHALAVAAREDRAFIFRGSRPVGAMLIQADRQAFAAQLVGYINRKAREDGA